MDERTRRMIEEYIPGARDEGLQEGEYYYLQTTSAGERVIRVWPLDILPFQHGTEYVLYQKIGGQMRWVDSRGDGDRLRGVSFAYLYDNKEDCRAQTHYFYESWEQLRKMQEADGR